MPQHTGSALVERRAENRAKGRFILRTDIARFYPSIYTHVIPWAFHGKEQAKANRTEGLGNELDRLVRTAQDGQTMGIPVGPDTSLVIAEAVAASLDADLSQFRLQGFRFMDDYLRSAFSVYPVRIPRDRAQSTSLMWAPLPATRLS